MVRDVCLFYILILLPQQEKKRMFLNMIEERMERLKYLIFSALMETCMCINLEQNQRMDGIRRRGRRVEPAFSVGKKEGYKTSL